ncbi:MAG: restriction endonuclease, partial [Bacteroidales bacterium]|nr:restriction endonuclease [Bacteroidales bacterium]
MENTDRSWHKNFESYAEMIAKNENYKGLFLEYENDRPKWVVTGKSVNGRKRLQWWNNQCKKHGIKIQKGCYAVITRLIHPTKKHVCQCCGKELSVYYEYPNKNLLKKLNTHFNISINQTDYTLRDFINEFCTTQYDLNFVASCFNLPDNLDKHSLTDLIYGQYVDKMKPPLSPGVMSNCPDRFDGFHSDGLCCREKTDKGRHKSNMQTYVQDRRAYENWSDGNWNLANRLMGEFHKQPEMKCPVCGNTAKMTADHIGPISLGFCHTVNFTP